jgi:hypothetical protein
MSLQIDMMENLDMVTQYGIFGWNKKQYDILEELLRLPRVARIFIQICGISRQILKAR